MHDTSRSRVGRVIQEMGNSNDLSMKYFRLFFFLFFGSNYLFLRGALQECTTTNNNDSNVWDVWKGKKRKVFGGFTLMEECKLVTVHIESL
jgi:hypothetical protein